MNGSKLEQIQANLKKAREIKQSIITLQQQANLQAMQQAPYDAQGGNYGQEDIRSQVKSEGKTLSLNNGHSILGDSNKGGFINTLIMALLVGFAGGAITTAIYIFINLGKVTVSL